MEWQPIETAPKNTNILVFMKGYVYEAEQVLRGSKFIWQFPFADYHGCGCCSEEVDRPTHWMPLPDFPSVEE